MPHANLTLRRVPEGISDDVALFAGDVMGTAYHAVASRPLAEGETGGDPGARARSASARCRRRRPPALER